MNIALFMPSLQDGGVQKVVVNLYSELKKKKINLSIIAADGNGCMSKYIDNNNLIDLFILIYILIFRKKLIEQDNNIESFLFIYALGLGFEFTGFFNPYVKRIVDYFLISRVLIIPYIPLIQTSSKNKILHTIIVFSYCVLVFIIIVYILKQSNIISYRFVGGSL